MSKETTYHAIVLKKQAFGEGDEIITFYTKEAGKVRGIAKSVKQPKSKLQSALQSLFFIKLTLAGNKRSGLKKVIRAEVLKTFSKIREHLMAAKTSFFALESTLKGTADEHKNEKLFFLLKNFLSFCDQNYHRPKILDFGLVKFKIIFLETLGLAVHYSSKLLNFNTLFFSNSYGGFDYKKHDQSSIPIKKEVFIHFLKIKNQPFNQLSSLSISNIKQLQNLLSGFLEYQLEREIMADRCLSDEM